MRREAHRWVTIATCWAAEYVLGTLDAAARGAARRELASNAGLCDAARGAVLYLSGELR